ncbi:MAG: peptide chain release factor N(5)-glutamine methyltransferase [Bryobacteraceae bacterium]
MTLQTALRQGSRLLEEAGVAAPRLTAELLLCHALRKERSYLYAHPEEELTELGWIHYGRYLHQRVKGRPTQYITKRQEFYGRDFRVTPDVLIPRPETEHVVETALRLAPSARRIVDVGTGSGAIAVTLALEMRTPVYATDLSLPALTIAHENARSLGADVRLIACDLTSALRGGCFDLLVSNPPYIPKSELPTLQREVRDYEPHSALFAGPTGLEVYERLTAEAERVLAPGGWLIVELGYQLLDGVRNLLGPRWIQTETISDLAGIPRVLATRFTP